jgi:hypothetical protein
MSTENDNVALRGKLQFARLFAFAMAVCYNDPAPENNAGVPSGTQLPKQQARRCGGQPGY